MAPAARSPYGRDMGAPTTGIPGQPSTETAVGPTAIDPRRRPSTPGSSNQGLTNEQAIILQCADLCKTEIGRLDTMISEQETQRTWHLNQATRFEKFVAQARAQKAEYIKRLNALDRLMYHIEQTHAKNKDLNQLLQSREHEIRRQNLQMEQMDVQKQTLEHDIRQLRNELSQSLAKEEVSTTKINGIEQQISEVNQRNSTLSAKNAKHCAEIVSLERGYTEIQAGNAVLKEQISELEQDKQQLEADLATERGAHSKLEQERDDAEVELQEAKDTNKSLEDRLAASEQKLEDSVKLLQDKDAIIEGFERAFDDAREMYTKTKSALRKTGGPSSVRDGMTPPPPPPPSTENDVSTSRPNHISFPLPKKAGSSKADTSVEQQGRSSLEADYPIKGAAANKSTLTSTSKKDSGSSATPRGVQTDRAAAQNETSTTSDAAKTNLTLSNLPNFNFMQGAGSSKNMSTKVSGTKRSRQDNDGLNGRHGKRR